VRRDEDVRASLEYERRIGERHLRAERPSHHALLVELRHHALRHLERRAIEPDAGAHEWHDDAGASEIRERLEIRGERFAAVSRREPGSSAFDRHPAIDFRADRGAESDSRVGRRWRGGAG
jgi:hypothetical protein